MCNCAVLIKCWRLKGNWSGFLSCETWTHMNTSTWWRRVVLSKRWCSYSCFTSVVSQCGRHKYLLRWYITKWQHPTVRCTSIWQRNVWLRVCISVCTTCVRIQHVHSSTFFLHVNEGFCETILTEIITWVLQILTQSQLRKLSTILFKFSSIQII